ncbi:GNAT family acetyltransferase [Streptomyces mashuensis]|uniref:GNAT family acetyltransferase n=1 Tax=Streptomyces mashuensis TaxID=33904 RepID=A0A919EGP2_9ACTN|nr:GNAT family N-acetyltransferase [Streptomyces mashuensis]GHF73118.1 GNAT family acetyltransferase [Streptomyces mashuensis]
MDDTFLETRRMRLRAFRANDEDLGLLVALDADPDVMRYINGGRPTSREEMRTQRLPRFRHVHPGLGTYGYWAAETRDDARAFLGWFEFRPLVDDRPDEVELGYRLRKEAWGRGYAVEGSRALIRKGFTELGVRRVTANAMTVHTASRRVMEKAGLRYVRTFFGDWPDVVEGSEHGDVEYALTRSEWEREHPGCGMDGE